MKMNVEDLAKRQLFNEDQFDIPVTYDPYRSSNILKDSNRNIDIQQKPTLTFHEQNTRKKWTTEDRFGENNNRISLKKLLQRLQAIPSPQKKQRNTQSTNFRTILTMASSTQASVIKKKSTTVLKTCNDECFSLSQVSKQKEKIIYNIKKNSLPLTPKITNGCQKKNLEQMRIQKLIKKKLAEKQETKLKNKTQKLINFLQTNNFTSSTKKKEYTNYSKFNSRKLINFLS